MSNIINTHSQVGALKALSPKHEGGFTLIEILVAIVILSIGLLGVASLQMQGLRSNQSAYLRSQATLLAYDMADRMRTNSEQALAFNSPYANFDSLGIVPPDPQCISNEFGCNSLDQARTDLFQWAERLNGTDESTILLPSAQGKIARNGENGNLFTITVSWKETQWDEETQDKQVSSQDFVMNVIL